LEGITKFFGLLRKKREERVALLLFIYLSFLSHNLFVLPDWVLEGKKSFLKGIFFLSCFQLWLLFLLEGSS
jgi:hypothetical protein